MKTILLILLSILLFFLGFYLGRECGLKNKEIPHGDIYFSSLNDVHILNGTTIENVKLHFQFDKPLTTTYF